MENVTFSESEIFEKLNSEYVKTRVGAVVFTAVFMLTGCVGNLHVLIVFGKRMKPSNNRTFICYLGIIDMIACTIGMPFTVAILLNPLTFYDNVSCKSALCVNYFVCASSGLILVVISVDRFRKICHPMGWQLSNKMARLVCIVVVCFAAVLALPAFFIYGHNTFSTKYDNITGSDCSTDDKFVATAYPTIFNLVLITLASVAFIVIVVLYILISRAIWNRGQQRLKMQRRTQTRSTINTITIETNTSIEFDNPSTFSMDQCPTTSLRVLMHQRDFLQSQIRMNAKNQDTMIKDTRRITVIFFIIIAVYFCSYIPNLILKIIAFLNYEYFRNLPKSNDVFYHIFSWFFFVNNVANSIVYAFLDKKYRAELKLFYGSCIDKLRDNTGEVVLKH